MSACCDQKTETILDKKKIEKDGKERIFADLRFQVYDKVVHIHEGKRKFEMDKNKFYLCFEQFMKSLCSIPEDTKVLFVGNGPLISITDAKDYDETKTQGFCHLLLRQKKGIWTARLEEDRSKADVVLGDELIEFVDEFTKSI